MSATPLSIGVCATLASLLEAAATKPGNVHRGADFEDLSFVDFAASAAAVGPIFDEAPVIRVGQTVLRAVRVTREMVGTNTNLGTVLLVAPLATVPRDEPLTSGIRRVLAELDADDARDVYEAIRLAQPGGMGQVAEADVAGPAPDDLLAAMRLAADRDRVARQYVTDFADVLGTLVPELSAAARQWPLGDAIVYTQLQCLARWPDSLIQRKCGSEIAQKASNWAGRIVAEGRPGDEAYDRAIADFDFWLRADGHRRNPGTTADLLAAGLFAALRDGIIAWPLEFYGW